MTYFFFESPILLGAALLLLMVFAWYAYLQSREKLAGLAAIGITLLSVILLSVNYAIETDREKITKFILEIAKELNENKTDRIADIVHPQASHEVQIAMLLLPRLVFEEARVTRIHSIDIDASEAPKTAQVRMNIFVKGEFGYYQFRSPRWVMIDLAEAPNANAPESPSWLVTHFEQREPHHEFMNP